MESDYRELERVVFLNAFQDRSMERTRLVQGSVTLLNPRSITGNTCLINSNEAVIMSWKRYAEKSSSISIKNSVVDFFDIFFCDLARRISQVTSVFESDGEQQLLIRCWVIWRLIKMDDIYLDVDCQWLLQIVYKTFFFFFTRKFYFFQLLRFPADTVAREF